MKYTLHGPRVRGREWDGESPKHHAGWMNGGVRRRDTQWFVIKSQRRVLFHMLSIRRTPITEKLIGFFASSLRRLLRLSLSPGKLSHVLDACEERRIVLMRSTMSWRFFDCHFWVNHYFVRQHSSADGSRWDGKFNYQTDLLMSRPRLWLWNP